MKFSFKAKLFLLVSAAISLVALPIIFFSRDFLIENSMEHERDAFANTVMLVEDNIGAHYLNMLSSEVDAVIIAKDDLFWCASMLRDMEDLRSSDGREKTLAQWQNFFLASGYHLAMFDRNALPIVADPLIKAATAPGIVDFKGQATRSMVLARKGQSGPSYAVAHVKDGDKGEVPLLLCFLPVPEQGMLVLAMQVADVLDNRLQAEKSLGGSVQERIDGLELSAGTSVAIISGKGEVQASRGVKIGLGDLPEAAREKARKGITLEGESVGPLG
ncbi:MAG: hypothetical protein IJC28_02670, partial [Mailhella sp.]|nr:hypothetical protein [Mailhella sp.]